MKYALIQCVNGNFSIVSEHGDNFEQARTAFYTKSASLSNASDVKTSFVMVADESLNTVGGLSARINHATNEE